LALLMGLLALPALAQQMAANATLTPRAGETARGTFAATQSGTTWTVTLRMTGLTANATHVNHIHTGSCEAEGGIVQPLADLRADAAGNATATTTFAAPGPLQPGAMVYANVHEGPALPSPGISCGNIVLGAAALPRTGGGLAAGSLVLPAALGAALAAGAGLWLRRRGQ
jgi:hypothetical protein